MTFRHLDNGGQSSNGHGARLERDPVGIGGGTNTAGFPRGWCMTLRSAQALVTAKTGRPRQKHPRSPFRWILPTLLVALMVSLGYWWFSHRWILTTGRVVMSEVHIMASGAGRLSELKVKEGDWVPAGQELARLADGDLVEDFKKAEAKVAESRARLESHNRLNELPAILMQRVTAERDVQMAKVRLQAAQAELAEVTLRVQQLSAGASRAERLYLLEAMTRESLEQRRLEAAQAKATVEVRTAKLTEAKTEVLTSSKILEKAEVMVREARQQHVDTREQLTLALKQAEALANQAQWRLQQQTSLHAPRDGVVAWLTRKEGEMVQPQDIIVSLLDPREAWVETYLPAAEVVYVEDGAKAYVQVEGLHESEYEGRVFLYPLSGRSMDRRDGAGLSSIKSASELPKSTLLVKIFLTTPPPDLRPELIARVRIARNL